MVYVPYVNTKPEITDAGSDVIDDTRENLEALRDAVIMGRMPSWDMTVTVGGGSAEEPDELVWDNSVYRVRAQITWGTSGGSDGNPTSIIYGFSGNSGMSYDTIGTLTITYDASGNVTASSWS